MTADVSGWTGWCMLVSAHLTVAGHCYVGTPAGLQCLWRLFAGHAHSSKEAATVLEMIAEEVGGSPWH